MLPWVLGALTSGDSGAAPEVLTSLLWVAPELALPWQCAVEVEELRVSERLRSALLKVGLYVTISVGNYLS